MKSNLTARFSRSHLIAALVIPLIAIAGIASGAGASNTPQTGYILCINKTTKAVTYPATLTCPKGSTQLALGARGVDGINGTNGTNGLNGRDGLSGLAGLTGLTGAVGLAGLAGADGLDGEDGVDGVDGQDGVDGVDGKDGADTSDTFALAQSLIDDLVNATYTIDCGGTFSTGTGISVTLSAALKAKGYKGALITASDGVADCAGQAIDVTQGDLSILGFVSTVDSENGLAMVVTKSVVNTLAPAEEEPFTGAFLMSVTRGGDEWPDGSIGFGILNNINSGEDADIHTIWISGKAMESASAPVINSLGQFVSIANKKPGVICRVLLSCTADSDYENWSN